MNFETYRSTGFVLYDAYAAKVAEILNVLVRNHPGLRLQQIQARAKSPASLEKKLADRGVDPTSDISGDIKDFAGCRMIFYTNADVVAFLKSRELFENFEIDPLRTKFHYPLDENSDELFISYNYVVRFKDDRTALAEYAPYAGLWCEIQVQTTLDHAWSEMAHDTLYKPAPGGFGSEVMTAVKTRMKSIVHTHLLPAGFDFQRVARDVRRLDTGREFLATDPLARLAASTNNEERLELIEKFRDYVLRYYDDLGAVAPSIQTAMRAAIAASDASNDDELPDEGEAWRPSPARTKSGIVAAAVSVIERTKYSYSGAWNDVLDLLFDLYRAATTDQARRRVQMAVDELAKQRLEVWRAVGPAVQKDLVSKVASLTDEELLAVRPLAVSIVDKALDPEINGERWGAGTVVMHIAGVAATDPVREMRAAAIVQARRLFETAAEASERAKALLAFHGATRMPYRGDITDAMVVMYLSHAQELAEYLVASLPRLTFEERQKWEETLSGDYRRARHLHKVYPAPEVIAARDAFLAAAEAYRDAVNADAEYITFKTLVGWQAVLPSAWVEDDFDVQRTQAERDTAIDQIVQAAGDRSYDHWRHIIARCITDSSSGAAFPSFRTFLHALALKEPGVVQRLLEQEDGLVSRFVDTLLLGLEKAGEAGASVAFAERWIADAKHLSAVCGYCEISDAARPQFLVRAAEAARSINDDQVVAIAMSVAGRFSTEAAGYLETVFMPGVRYFVGRDANDWIEATWHWFFDGTISEPLTAEDADLIAATLIDLPTISNHAEYVLAAIARRWPAKAIDVFAARIRKAREEVAGYEAVPFALHALPERMADHGPLAVATLRELYAEDNEHFAHSGGELIARLFPQLGTAEPPLEALARGGSDEDIRFVLSTLEQYEGNAFLDRILRDIVERIEPDSPLANGVEHVIEMTGVLSGEFGRAEAMIERRDRLSNWLSDARPRVAAYADRHIRSLESQIAGEQRRSMEEHQLRLREYGEA